MPPVHGYSTCRSRTCVWSTIKLTFAWLGGEVRQLREPGVLVLQTHKPEANILLRFILAISRRASNRHTETLRERGNLLVSIAVEVLLGIVHRHTAVDGCRQGSILHNGHLLVGAVLMLEVHVRCPVVAEVLREGASGAGGLLANVANHCGIEGITADNLMDVCRGNMAGFNEGVEALDGKS